MRRSHVRRIPLGMLMSFGRVCEFLPRMLASRQVLLLSLLLAHSMAVCGALV